MKTMLLGLAAATAVIIPAVPAQAERWSDSGFVAAANVAVHRGSSGFNNRAIGRQWTDGRDRRRHHHGGRGRDRSDGDVFIGEIYREDNPAWHEEGYNDWWHESPARSVPRWVKNNQNCERQYWTGAGWKC